MPPAALAALRPPLAPPGSRFRTSFVVVRLSGRIYLTITQWARPALRDCRLPGSGRPVSWSRRRKLSEAWRAKRRFLRAPRWPRWPPQASGDMTRAAPSHAGRDLVGLELLLQQLGKDFAELCDLRGHDRLAVRLPRVVREVFLMVVLGGIERRRLGDFGHDSARVHLRRIEPLDDVFGDPLLFVVSVENRRIDTGFPRRPPDD